MLLLELRRDGRGRPGRAVPLLDQAEPPAAPIQPTAMQNELLMQDTPDRKVGVEDNGLDWTTLHVVPFQVSISGAKLVVSTAPTATQNDVVTQETPVR